MDGNGRMERFLINVLLAWGGYPWTVIAVENRDEYMQAALERSSAGQDIVAMKGHAAVHLPSNKGIKPQSYLIMRKQICFSERVS